MPALSVDVEEHLLWHLQTFLESHSDWNQSRVINVAISLFLMQQGLASAKTLNIYMNNLKGEKL